MKRLNPRFFLGVVLGLIMTSPAIMSFGKEDYDASVSYRNVASGLSFVTIWVATVYSVRRPHTRLGIAWATTPVWLGFAVGVGLITLECLAILAHRYL
ncbi:hypothetical protein COU19_03390 [Candidatus Kaiserbacteria bacterium CG10_big_fil_rev_8_21_14_0_10_56_12]|uniref:Uncharacterized protein n=1 Tax=Candidatus Kaiserbacteria bacterium CG10_big_fil_rev_8_21_14_0_10_56_12 TaxID=1974611 RepID=A0A2H0U922_9BACT|nr:MAG: hypothetical protein COU19_03390 [Candidatus Kaiserbacteria bacterium CG10_big_fil_rev_8_21_14_0_10_56_12]